MAAYSTIDYELQFTDGSTVKFSFSPLDTSKVGNFEGRIRNFNAILKDEEPLWYDYIANENGAKVDTDVGIVSATITNYNETTIL
ncbi:MAG: hypothetical protein IJO58_04455 [Clostridia bacterium]|nr:hypothetical protein [Clostridia bacterium]